MTDPKALSWEDLRTRSKSRGFLAKQLFRIETIPLGGVDAIEANLAEHLKYQLELERNGIMFAAGPLCDVASQTWQGRGMIVVRAENYEAARKIADADPMHKNGARRYVLTPWLINEGVQYMRVTYSTARVEIE